MAEQKSNESSRNHTIDSVCTSDKSDPAPFAAGDIVCVHGLLKCPKLNGLHAIICRQTNERYAVRVLLQNGKKKGYLIKPQNLALKWPDAFNKCNVPRCAYCEMPATDPVYCAKCLYWYCSTRCRKEHDVKGTMDCSLCHKVLCKDLSNIFKVTYDEWYSRTKAFRFRMISDYDQEMHGVTDMKALMKWEKEQKSMQRDLIKKMESTPQVIKCWEEWYEFHATELTICAAQRYTNVMTVYWSLIKIGVRPNTKKTITIHMVGVDGQELRHLYAFGELGILLPKVNLTIHFIGPEIDEIRSSASNLKICGKVIQCRFHKKCYPLKIGKPDVVVGLNAGIGSYFQQWVPAIKYVMRFKIPSFFTEYNRQIMAVCVRNGTLWCGGRVQYIGDGLNPFVKPLADIDSTKKMMYLNNNILFRIVK